MAPRTVWAEIRPHLRDPDNVPEWLCLVLRNIRFGSVHRIPKRGALPNHILRDRARLTFTLALEEGATRTAAVHAAAKATGVHERTVWSWVSSYHRSPPVIE